MSEWLKKIYNTPFVHGLVAAAEGGLMGAIMDATMDPVSIFTKQGAKHLAASAATGVVIAVRNYLKDRPGQPGSTTPKS